MDHLLSYRFTPLGKRVLVLASLLLVLWEKRIPPQASVCHTSHKKPTLVRGRTSGPPRGAGVAGGAAAPAAVPGASAPHPAGADERRSPLPAAAGGPAAEGPAGRLRPAGSARPHGRDDPTAGGTGETRAGLRLHRHLGGIRVRASGSRKKNPSYKVPITTQLFRGVAKPNVTGLAGKGRRWRQTPFSRRDAVSASPW